MIIWCLNTPNEVLTSWKVQPCTHNQSWNQDILNSNSYCILCSIVLLHVKIKNVLWNCCTSLIICCLITLKYILSCWKFQTCTAKKVEIWTFQILTISYCSIALLHVKNKITQTTLKLLYIFHYFLFNHNKVDINLLKISMMYSWEKLMHRHFKF